MKKNIKQIVSDYVLIMIGTFFLSFAVNFFLAPNKLSAGGVTSLGTVLLHLFNIKLSVTNFISNVILFILGYRYLGKYAVSKTIAGIVFYSLFLELTSYITPYTSDIFISSTAGGILMGIGVGLVVRCEGSTGGSDFAALIIKRFLPHISLANLILFMDCTIIVISGITFKSFTITFYSVILLYISAKVTDAVISIGDVAKSILIMSSKGEEIAKKIMEQFSRGVTGVHCKGMYLENETLALLCVVSPKEMPVVANLVRKIDRSAFIVINDAREVLGEGFKVTSTYDKIQ